MSKKRQVLWAHELVQLVVPTAAHIQWRSAHVARVGDDRTVCGFQMRYWWFRCKETQTAGELCEKWTRETGDPYTYPHLHIQGTHLGGALDIKPDLCGNCHMLVMDGKRLQWASKDERDEDVP